MVSDTKNVKLGVCKLYYDGSDLGYTQGGVEVTVTTETHKVNVDQFGKTTINELIIGRMVAVKTNLAETTLENMVAIMPGASMSVVGGSAASGSLTVVTLPVAGETIIVNGTTVTFRSSVTGIGVESLIGSTAALSGPILAAALNKSTNSNVGKAVYTASGAVVTATYASKAAIGNAFTLGVGTAGVKFTSSGATLTGGSEPSSKRVEVNVGIGIDMLSLAREIRLHPFNKAASDTSEDFIIPLAASAGALTFAYQLEAERVYAAEFNGYPDPDTGSLFYIGT